MIALPAWDSLENVTRINFWCHIAALAFVFFLALSEIFAFVYGERKETLTETRDRAAATAAESQRKRDADAAEAWRKSEVETLNQQLAEAGEKVTKLEKQGAQRHLTEANKTALVAALTPFAGQRVQIVSVQGDTDGEIYVQDFLPVLRAAGWVFNEGTDVSTAVFKPTSPVDIEVVTNPDDYRPGHYLAAANSLATILHELGIMQRQVVLIAPDTAVGVITIRIGIKPRTP